MVDLSKSEKNDDFVKFVRRHEPRLRSYAVRSFRDSQFLDEAMQETFLTTWRKFEFVLHDLEPNQHFSWLCGVFTRKMSNILRRERRLTRKLELFRNQGFKPSTQIEDQTIMSSLIDQIVGHMNPSDRMIALLIVWEDASAQQIAIMRNCSLPTAQKKMQRVRQQIRELMQEFYE